MNRRLKQAIAGLALVAGFFAGGAAVAWAQSSPGTPTTPPATTPGSAPAGSHAPGSGGSANCPNM
jgi:hypothetical protein